MRIVVQDRSMDFHLFGGVGTQAMARPMTDFDRKDKIAEAKFNIMKYRLAMFEKMKSEESRRKIPASHVKHAK